MPTRVCILYNADAGLARGDEPESLAVRAVREEVDAAEAACRENGWEAASFPVRADPREVLAALDAARPDLVFNLVETFAGRAEWEGAVAWLLEMAGVPFTGSPPFALSLGLRKPLVKDLLRVRGVPVPRGCVLESADDPMPPLRFPCIVKPAREDASNGISVESVVADRKAARARARVLIERFAQPAVVEEFIEGREFNVSILGEGAAAEALPLGEIDFTRFPRGLPKLVTYEAKWVAASPEYRGTASVAAGAMSEELRKRVTEAALAAYRAVGLRDYGRVDVRACAERGPFVLEANPNPDLSPGAGLALAAERAGLSYPALVGRIVRSALARAGR